MESPDSGLVSLYVHVYLVARSTRKRHYLYPPCLTSPTLMPDVGVNGVSSIMSPGDRSTTFASFYGDRVTDRNRGLVAVCGVEAGSEVGEDLIFELDGGRLAPHIRVLPQGHWE
jgi:hypothetical protein